MSRRPFRSTRNVVATRCNSLLRGLALATTVLLAEGPRSLHATHATSALCTMLPGTVVALVRVEQVMMVPFAPAPLRPMSMAGVRAGPGDSLLATPGTPMPGARVRLLQLDSATRGLLAAHGVSDSQPVAIVRAAPYRADCRIIRWLDTIPFVELGETGYVRATLVPREQWITGVPVLIISDTWGYPYPRRRGLAFGVPANAPLASAEAMFSLNAALEMPRSVAAENERRVRALAWARANAGSAELEPVRREVRRAVLAPDWRAVVRIPSRLRGTYRVDMDAAAGRATWFFRTHDRPGYGWRVPDSVMTTADLIASPHGAGYQLVGFAAASLDSLPVTDPTGPGRARPPLVARHCGQTHRARQRHAALAPRRFRVQNGRGARTSLG